MLQFYQINKPKYDKDFDRLAGMKLFKEQINWFQSKEAINMKYVEKFVNAIENGTELPILTANDEAIPRTPLTGMGVVNDRFIC